MLSDQGSSPVLHILWDWNGTLLNDVHLCHDLLNELCRKYNLPEVSLDRYLDTFTFPVIDYYKAMGFDPDIIPFDDVAQYWTDRYTAQVMTEACLYDGVLDTLRTIEAEGIGQSILSAHHHDTLVDVTRKFGVEPYLDPILGLGDYYARSKLDVGRGWLQQSGMEPSNVLLVGDTLHDHEVAEGLGTQCVLIPNGHQSRNRFAQSGVVLAESVRDICSSTHDEHR